MNPQDFAYHLPEERIAQQPASQRDACRLMRLQRSDGGITDHRFDELPDLLRPGDLLVLNDTRVVPAKFVVRRATGGKIEGLFLRESADGAWRVLLKNAGRCRPAESLDLAPGQALVVESREGQGQWTLRPSPAGQAEAILAQFGATPLPPYIRRPGPMSDREDRQCYQTVFARSPGAVAAPTAGLHFTEPLMERLAARGVDRTYVTLHVGLGTFAPVKADEIADHKMHAEWYELPAAAVEALTRTRARGGRVVAVGTTAVRVLETAGRQDGPLTPHSGWTDIFLYPPAAFRWTDALITNFHLPGSTLIMLVAAFCSPGRLDGRQQILDAYRRAVDRGYQFYSYGDAMLIA